MLQLPLMVVDNVPPRIKTCWMKPRSTDLWDNIILNEADDVDYIGMFRMSESTLDMICRELHAYLAPHPNKIVREPISVKKKVAVALYKMASCSEYRVVGNVFGIHKSTVHKCLYEFVEAVNKILRPKYIKMPSLQEAKQIAERVELKTGMIQSFGFIDGTHIPVLPPKEGYRDFINRKGWPSMILQAVVDDLYCFRDITISYPGSCHDAAVFKNSNLYKRADEVIPKSFKEVEGENVPLMILGDPAYPMLPWLQKPYTGMLTPEEESFNCYLSSARIAVENAFGRLKARWRCILKRVDVNYTFVPGLVSACCVLHNIVESEKEVFRHQWLQPVKEIENVFPQPQAVATNVAYENAQQMRDHLKRVLAQRYPLRKSTLRRRVL